MTIVVRRGQIYVNDRRVDNLPAVYQKMVPKIVDHFDPADLSTDARFKAWTARQEGRTRRFPCSGVILKLENGDRYSVPVLFFSEEDLNGLQFGWERWTTAQEGSFERER